MREPGEREPGKESKYARKERLQTLGLYPRFGQTPEQQDREEPKKFSSQRFETSSGIIIRLNLLPSPLAFQVVSHGCAREIYSLLGKAGLGEYTLKQSGYRSEGRGEISAATTASDFFEKTPWLTNHGRDELKAIIETMEREKSTIEKYIEENVRI